LWVVDSRPSGAESTPLPLMNNLDSDKVGTAREAAEAPPGADLVVPAT
jgi:hypothetical protein